MNRQHTKFTLPRAAAVAAMITILLVGTLSAAYAADLGGIRRQVTLWVRGKPVDAQVEVHMDDGSDTSRVTIADDDGSAVTNEGEYAVTQVVEGEGADAYTGYTVTWTDEDGVEHEMSGGGVAIDFGGVERPLTVDEIMEDMDGASEVERTDDGRVMLYWYDNAVDITDRFEDGVCRIMLTHGEETMYFTILDTGEGSFNVSAASDGYIDV